jgi:uncharacterized protein YaaQ
MEESLKFAPETMDKVGLLRMYLEEGMSIDETMKKMKISEENFFQLYELALSDEYKTLMEQAEQERVNNFFYLIDERCKEREKEIEEKEKRNKENINLLSVLTEEDLSQAVVFVVEYSINLSEVKYYYLGSYKTICDKFWVTYVPDMSEQAICQTIKERMREKGFHNVRNLKLLSPVVAYMEYLEAIKAKKKKDLVSFEADNYFINIAKKRIGL